MQEKWSLPLSKLELKMIWFLFTPVIGKLKGKEDVKRKRNKKTNINNKEYKGTHDLYLNYN